MKNQVAFIALIAVALVVMAAIQPVQPFTGVAFLLVGVAAIIVAVRWVRSSR